MIDEEKIIDKVRKLKAKADSCEQIGNKEEAEAFAAAVNNLLLKYNLSMSEIDWEKRDAEDPIHQVWVDFESYGIDVKHQRREWSERLASIIAKAHFCKIVVSTNSNRVALVGHKSNREVAEYLFITLYRLAEQMAEKEYVKYFYECKRNGGVEQARGFKAAWLLGFIRGLDERFMKERQTVKADYDCRALIRIDQSLAKVEAWMKLQRYGKGHSLHQLKFHAEGIKRGKAAADEVSLRANALRNNPNASGQRRIG